MSNLFERARALICSKPAMMGALVIVPLATAARTAEANVGFYSYGTGSVSITSNSGGSVSGTLGGSGFNPLSLFTVSPIKSRLQRGTAIKLPLCACSGQEPYFLDHFR